MLEIVWRSLDSDTPYQPQEEEPTFDMLLDGLDDTERGVRFVANVLRV